MQYFAAGAVILFSGRWILRGYGETPHYPRGKSSFPPGKHPLSPGLSPSSRRPPYPAVYWFWLTVLFVIPNLVYTLLFFFLYRLSVRDFIPALGLSSTAKVRNHLEIVELPRPFSFAKRHTGLPEHRYSFNKASLFSSVISPFCRILIYFFESKSVNSFSTRHQLFGKSILCVDEAVPVPVILAGNQ